MAAKIHSTDTGLGPDVILIHGLFGMGNNLGKLARSLEDRYQVHCVDLPNHGRSDWISDTDIPEMARVLLAWMDREDISSAAVVGHSLGGKVAMEMALQRPGRINALVVADIAPVAYPASHSKEFAALEAVAAARCYSRSEAYEVMSGYLENDMVIQFLLMNLARAGDGSYFWRFNLKELMAGYEAIRAAVGPHKPYASPVLFIKGGDSSYILEEHRNAIMALFPGAVLKVMPGCGHWLHADQPRLFNSLVARFLDG